MILVPNGTVGGGVITVEVSHDGTNWVAIATLVPRSGVNQRFDNTTGAYRYWRTNIAVAIEGGGTVSTTFMEADR